MKKFLGFIALLCASCGDASSGKAQGDNQMNDSDFQCGGMDAREVLEVIRKQGAVLTNIREGVFYFYGPEHALPTLQHDLEGLGFNVRPTKTEAGRIATIEAVIDEAWLAHIIPEICKLTKKSAIEYDGWEASIPEAQSK